MILTRLGAQYNSGTVVGFNSSTGSVIIIANTAILVQSFDYIQFQLVKQSTLKDYPSGYVWPSLNDFWTLGVDLQEPKLFENKYVLVIIKKCKILDNMERCFLLTNYASSSKGKFSHSICQILAGSKVTAHIGSYRFGWNYGHLLPVLYINGENCDTYEI